MIRTRNQWWVRKRTHGPIVWFNDEVAEIANKITAISMNYIDMDKEFSAGDITYINKLIEEVDKEVMFNNLKGTDL
jgi:hypothetical protein